MPLDRRQLLQTLTATLAISHVRVSEQALETIAAAPDAPAVYPSSFAAKQFLDPKYDIVPPGRFLYGPEEFASLSGRTFVFNEQLNALTAYQRYCHDNTLGHGPLKREPDDEFPPLEEGEVEWGELLVIKARSMARLRVCFDRLAQHSSEEALKGLHTHATSDGMGFYEDVMNNLDGWPGTGGDAKRDALKKTLQQERDHLFAFADAKLPKDQALAVRQAYETGLATVEKDMVAAFDKECVRARDWFSRAVRQGLANGYITADLGADGNGVTIQFDFSPEHPKEGLTFVVDTPSGRSRDSTIEDLKFGLKKMRQLHLIGDGTTLKEETSKVPDQWYHHTDRLTITSSDPAMFEMARKVSAQLAQHQLYGDLEKMIGRFSSFAVKNISDDVKDAAEPDAAGMIDITPPRPVVYQISYKPPQGADALLDFNRAWGDFSSRAEALATVLQRNGDSSISIDPRTRTIELTLDPKREPAMIETLQSAAKRQVGD